MSTSKFSGLLAGRKGPANTAALGDAPEAQAPVSIVRDRPLAKSKNPDWKQYSILLKKKTQAAASVALIERGSEEGDLSDLMQKLLESWVETQKG